MTSVDARVDDHSSMVITWSEADDAFAVTVPGLPGRMTHNATSAEAVRQGEDAIATWLDTARAWGDPIPEACEFAVRAG